MICVPIGPDAYAHLQCPKCGNDYLHHSYVNVFSRMREDDREVVKTTVCGAYVNSRTVPSYKSGNPSSRRDGITITFDCENCGYFAELEIAQHKGNTHLSWGNLRDGTDDTVHVDMCDLPIEGAYFTRPHYFETLLRMGRQ